MNLCFCMDKRAGKPKDECGHLCITVSFLNLLGSMGAVSYRELESKTYTLRVVARAKNGDTAVLKRRVRTG